MRTQNIIALFCILGLVSFVQAGIEVSVTDAIPGFVGFRAHNNDDNNNRKLGQSQNTICRFFLLTHDQMNIPEDEPTISVVLKVNGPPYDGIIPTLNFQNQGLNYVNDLSRIVYDGDNCDCTVTVFQQVNNEGKWKDYESSGESGHIDLGRCWSDHAASLSIACTA